MNEKYFAVKTDLPCKCCGNTQGYMTKHHKVIVAKKEDKDLLLIPEDGEVVEVDLDKLREGEDFDWVDINLAFPGIQKW